MGEPCPCCGQPLPENSDMRIDEAGFIVRAGRFATLTRQELTILLALKNVAPRVRSKEQLMADLYWSENEDPEIKIIDVWICKLRKKLQPLGVVIETIWGRGYRLVSTAARKEAV